MSQPRASITVICLLLLVLAALPAAAQQAEEVVVEIGGQFRSQLRLAFPKADFDPSLGGETYVAEEVEQTLRDDLDYAGIFNVQGPTELAVLTLSGERRADFEQYRSLGNELVLQADVKVEGGKLVVEGRLYDLASAMSVLGKRYRGQMDQGRRLAHTLADDLYRQFTNRPSLMLTEIVFQSDRDGGGFKELYLMDYDGRNQRRISHHQSTSGFADWSPTRDAIAYLSYFTGKSGVFYVDLATSEKVKIYDGGNLTLSPSFAPDGQRLAFAHATASNVDIYLCERQCTSPRRITSSPAIDTNPAWSPLGERIAFTSDRSGRPNVYVMDTDGKNVRRISNQGNYNEGACWHPDGKKLVYASRQGNKFRVAMTDLISLETLLLAEGSDSYEEPCFSPDGRRVLFTLKRGRASQVWVMNADGSDWQQLTHEGNNMSADWSPFPP
jgi:TolB protein